MSANILERGALHPATALWQPAPPRQSEAIRALYLRHYPQVRRLVNLYYRGDTGAAEDIAQDVFVTLCEEFERLDTSRPLQGWFSRVTINRCRSRRRRDVVATTYVARKREITDREGLGDPDPETMATRHLEFEHVNDLLHRLPIPQQQVLRGYHFEGEKQIDIGRRMGISKSYVCKLLKAAVENLREQMGDADQPRGPGSRVQQ